MKTKEEIFNKHSHSYLGAISPSKPFCLSAMQEYADQETASLRAELESAKKLNQELTDECNRNLKLIFEQDELRKELSAAKAELERVKTAAAKLCVLHAQEQEGLNTVSPTAWIKATDELTDIIGEDFWKTFHETSNL